MGGNLRYLKSFIPHVASYASIAGLYLTAYPWDGGRDWWHWILIAACAALAFYTTYVEFLNAKRETCVQFKCPEKISKYMCDWVSKPGRTVIFSRDLSWGSDKGAKSALVAKAKSRELTIYVQTTNSFTDYLLRNGAEINLYDGVCPDPMSRFTIVGYGKEGARIAVAAPKGGVHKIYEFDFGEHPIFSIAHDLLRTIDQGKANA